MTYIVVWDKEPTVQGILESFKKSEIPFWEDVQDYLNLSDEERRRYEAEYNDMFLAKRVHAWCTLFHPSDNCEEILEKEFYAKYVGREPSGDYMTYRKKYMHRHKVTEEIEKSFSDKERFEFEQKVMKGWEKYSNKVLLGLYAVDIWESYKKNYITYIKPYWAKDSFQKLMEDNPYLMLELLKRAGIMDFLRKTC